MTYQADDGFTELFKNWYYQIEGYGTKSERAIEDAQPQSVLMFAVWLQADDAGMSAGGHVARQTASLETMSAARVDASDSRTETREGWRWVPPEATESMLCAAREVTIPVATLPHQRTDIWSTRYRAFLSTAPLPAPPIIT